MNQLTINSSMRGQKV